MLRAHPVLSTLPFFLAACAADVTPRGAPDGAPPPADASAADTGPPGDPDAAPGDAALDDSASPADGSAPPGPAPFAALDDVSLYVIVGDSVAAGYDASGRNDEGGRAFARLFFSGHAAYPAWAGRDLRARFAGARFERVAESGATSGDALANLRDALRAQLPASVSGDVVVSIHVGGNDFNDDPRILALASATAPVAAQLRANIAEMIRLLADRYHDPASGRTMLAMVHDVHDPTDGTGAIPAGFDEGFCATLQNPLLRVVAASALANLGTINAAIAGAAEDNVAVLVAQHAHFLGHGMNAAGADRWLSDDCTHPNDEGHHQLRVAARGAIGAP